MWWYLKVLVSIFVTKMLVFKYIPFSIEGYYLGPLNFRWLQYQQYHFYGVPVKNLVRQTRRSLLIIVWWGFHLDQQAYGRTASTMSTLEWFCLWRSMSNSKGPTTSARPGRCRHALPFAWWDQVSRQTAPAHLEHDLPASVGPILRYQYRFLLLMVCRLFYYKYLPAGCFNWTNIGAFVALFAWHGVKGRAIIANFPT